MLLPGAWNAAGRGLDQPANPHANQHVYTYHDVYPRSPNGYPAACYRHGYHYGDRHAFVHALADIHTVPHSHRYPNADPHSGSTHADLYTYSTNADVYAHSPNAHQYACSAHP